MATDVDPLLREQIAYYRARAAEYDEWCLRQGRYDRGPEQTRHWFDEVDEGARALEAFAPRGRVLELACGTGWWTERLARFAESVTAIDHHLEGPEAAIVTRRLNDGRTFRIVKVFYEPGELAARLAQLGWSVTVRGTAHHFLYGFGSP